MDGYEAAQLMHIIQIVQKLKRRFIAKTLSDIETEFQHSDTLNRRITALKAEVDARGAINTDMLVRTLEDFSTQMPDYQIVRKIVLDNFNEFSRNIFQALLGDVEGYGSSTNRPRYQRRDQATK